ncbi:MAG: hypothetical protein OXE50_12115 [Chloroflexi bacterium]|nr:hypothetical protein [Chloroflexota bacterium]
MNNIGVYEKLGVRRVINAWGVSTELGGWSQTENVTRAMEEANLGTVEMRELLQKSGDFIADLLGVEAAFVTSGAAAAQALSVAASMAGSDPDRIAQLPDTAGMKNEVVIQKRNRYMFDRCYTLTGARLVEAGNADGTTEEELDAAIGTNTTAVAYYIRPPIDDAIVSLEDTVALARSRGVTALADACSEIYPLDYFRRCAQSADLVTVGAKYLGAPHSAGFVCGKRDLIDAVAAQSFVAYHYDGGKAVGRAMKIDRHEIIGVVTAMEDWFTMDHEERLLEYESRFAVIVDALHDLDGVSMRRVEIPYYVPYMLYIDVDESIAGKSAEQVTVELDAGSPRIWVGAEDGSVRVVVNCMTDDETAFVSQRLREALGGG